MENSHAAKVPLTATHSLVNHRNADTHQCVVDGSRFPIIGESTFPPEPFFGHNALWYRREVFAQLHSIVTFFSIMLFYTKYLSGKNLHLNCAQFPGSHNAPILQKATLLCPPALISEPPRCQLNTFIPAHRLRALSID